MDTLNVPFFWVVWIFMATNQIKSLFTVNQIKSNQMYGYTILLNVPTWPTWEWPGNA